MENIDSKCKYKCPVCGLGLIKQEKQYTCERGHSYDISGKGYVNLLLVNQKKTKDPGDNKDMIENRRNFLNKGYYLRLSESLNGVICSNLKNKSNYILDAGCGEGYFISNLNTELHQKANTPDLQCHGIVHCYGIDISKSAIYYAARRDNKVYFAVGSTFNLPIVTDSFDCVIRNFAPGDNKEFHRILNKSGKLIIVTPGMDHLFELKERLYEKARKHEVKDLPFEGFNCIDHHEIKYNILLQNSEDIRSLITMTPYYWSISKEMKENIDNIDSFITTLNFNINVYSKITN